MQATIYIRRFFQIKHSFSWLLVTALTLITLSLTAQNRERSLPSAAAHANIQALINRITHQQVGADPVFLKGSYPSYIHHRRRFKQKHKDITIFYNILVDMTLKELRPKLSAPLQIKVDSLLARSKQIYPRFYNSSRGTYNFWLRDSSYRFPYSWWIPIIKKDGAVPDDMDDTVLSTFLEDAPNRDSLLLLHQRMQAFSLQPGQKLHTAPKAYRSFPTYSTWFGEKFPVVLDAAVLSNILSFVCRYDLPWSPADSAALGFIVKSIHTGDYIHHPLKLSPYYGKTAILLYHYSRLMQQKRLSQLDSLRDSLIKAAQHIITSSHQLMEKIIAANALIQLGAPAPALSLPKLGSKAWQQEIEKSDYAYFIGNIPSYMGRTLQSLLTSTNSLMYYHYCPAFNNALVLQYLVGRSAH